MISYLSCYKHVKRKCPFCKRTFESIIYNVKAIDKFEEYSIPPPILQIPDNSDRNGTIYINNIFTEYIGIFDRRPSADSETSSCYIRIVFSQMSNSYDGATATNIEASTTTDCNQKSTDCKDTASSVSTDFDRPSSSFEGSKATETQTTASRNRDESELAL